MSNNLSTMNELSSAPSLPSFNLAQGSQQCSVCHMPNRSAIHNNGYKVTLNKLQKQRDLGCPYCRLLYDSACIFKSRWSHLGLDKVFMSWETRTDYIRWFLLNVHLGAYGDRDLLISLKFDCSFFWRKFLSPAPDYTKVQDLSSPAAFDKIHRWLRDCTETHEKCRITDPILPKRVLDVGIGNEYKDVQLCEIQGAGQYITLSHCWGTGTSSLPPLRTLKENMKERQSCIKWNHLSKVFQDAVSVCRKLQVRYLWIDSLCIIQDDPEDWKEQASKMHEIYERSYLTIAATGAKHGGEGLFQICRKTLYDAVIVGEQPSHVVWLAGWSGEGIPDFFTQQPLCSRGWCFQERLLPTRVLHFTTTEMFWECKAGVKCECTEEVATLHGFKQKFPNDSQWRVIVKYYTRTMLTFDKDMLPALSGVAARVEKLKHSRYLAGLWADELPHTLLWASDGPARRTSSYVAPSFSWASRIGPVNFQTVGDNSIIYSVSVVEAMCEADDTSPFGAVSRGYLKCRGSLLPADVKYTAENMSDEVHLKIELPSDQKKAIEKYNIFWDALDDFSPNSSQCFYFLPILSFPWCTCALILKKTRQTRDETYSRVGMVNISVHTHAAAPLMDAVLKLLPEKEVTIV